MPTKANVKMMAEAINRVALYKIIFKPWPPEQMKKTLKFTFRQAKLIINDELLSQEMKRREGELRQVAAAQQKAK